jgi:hypothetical protein
MGLPSRAYISDILVNRQSGFSDGALKIISSPTTLDFVLDTDGGIVTGQLSGYTADNAGATATLTPAAGQVSPYLTRVAKVDIFGHFEFDGVAPGSYYIFVWSPDTPNGFWESERIQSKYKDVATMVSVAAKADISSNVPLAISGRP